MKCFAGAAKANITPPGELMPLGRVSKLDSTYELYVHTLVVRIGQELVFLITFDAGDAPGKLFKEKLSDRFNIPVDHILCAGIHNHALYWGKREKSIGGLIPPATLNNMRYESLVWQATCDSIQKALEGMTDAELSYGEIESYVNTNRTIENGISDKTLSTLAVKSTEGRLIAVLINYPCHDIFLHNSPAEDGTLIATAGMASVVLSELRRKYPLTEFLWTCGAGADQKMLNDPNDGKTQAKDVESLLDDLIFTVPESLRVRTVNAILNEQVSLPITLISIGNIEILGIAGEMYTEIGIKIKDIMPRKNRIIITSTERNHAGFLVSDACSDQDNFMTHDIVKPGHLDDMIVSAVKNLMI